MTTLLHRPTVRPIRVRVGLDTRGEWKFSCNCGYRGTQRVEKFYAVVDALLHLQSIRQHALSVING